MINKANENKIAGEWAESQGLYHIALSRFYYSLYQKMIYIDETKPLGISNRLPPNGRGSHKDFIQLFKQECQSLVTSTQLFELDKLNRLRRLRNKEEYNSTREVNKKNYIHKVKKPYININNILDAIISGS